MSEGEALSSEEGMVIGTGEVIGSTLGSEKMSKLGLIMELIWAP